ncbi:MAG: hypothetical protein ACRCXN_07415 [Bacteroidales bacterium]
MFVNVSNIPLSDWQDAQLDEAKLYGRLYEFRMPEIDPEASTSALTDVAKVLASRIAKVVWENDESKNAVMVLGEPSFSFTLIRELQNLRLTVLCPTYRIDLYDDEELIETFVRFRNYPISETLEEDE